MSTHDDRAFIEATEVFFRTLEEQGIKVDRPTRIKMMGALANMRHRWGPHHDRCSRIMEVEQLAVELAAEMKRHGWQNPTEH